MASRYWPSISEASRWTPSPHEAGFLVKGDGASIVGEDIQFDAHKAILPGFFQRGVEQARSNSAAAPLR
jgi:hypothetical protein